MSIKVKKITVEENGRKQDVIIPLSDDKKYDDYLIVAETERTREQLKKMPAPKVVNMKEREVLGAQLKEYREYRRRKSENINKRYF